MAPMEKKTADMKPMQAPSTLRNVDSGTDTSNEAVEK